MFNLTKYHANRCVMSELISWAFPNPIGIHLCSFCSCFRSTICSLKVTNRTNYGDEIFFEKNAGLEKPKAKAKPKAKSFGKALRNKVLEKAKLEKAKAQSFGKDSQSNKSSSSKALGKAKAKSLGKGSKAKQHSSMKVLKKTKLSKANLEKCGSLSLQEKMKMATEEAEDAEEAAALLKKMIKLESSKLWSKHQTALKNGPEKDKEEFDALSKKDKGIAACQGKQYLGVLKQVSVGDKLTREDKWDSEIQILQKFSKKELDLHIQSGRVQWRECPTTWGVFEYKDTQNWSRQVSTSRKKQWTSVKEYDPEEEDLEKLTTVLEKAKVLERAKERAKAKERALEKAKLMMMRRRMRRRMRRNS